MGDLKAARCWKSAGDLPDVSKCFHGLSIHASDTLLLCMGLFSIFWLGGEHGVGLAAGKPGTPAATCGRGARLLEAEAGRSSPRRLGRRSPRISPRKQTAAQKRAFQRPIAVHAAAAKPGGF